MTIDEYRYPITDEAYDDQFERVVASFERAGWHYARQERNRIRGVRMLIFYKRESRREVLVCEYCDYTMPYGSEKSETPCPEGYEHDPAYPFMRREVLEPLPPLVVRDRC